MSYITISNGSKIIDGAGNGYAANVDIKNQLSVKDVYQNNLLEQLVLEIIALRKQLADPDHTFEEVV